MTDDFFELQERDFGRLESSDRKVLPNILEPHFLLDACELDSAGEGALGLVDMTSAEGVTFGAESSVVVVEVFGAVVEAAKGLGDGSSKSVSSGSGNGEGEGMTVEFDGAGGAFPNNA